jgi:hypothetical protein
MESGPATAGSATGSIYTVGTRSTPDYGTDGPAHNSLKDG